MRNRSDTGLSLNEVIPLPSDEDLNIEHDLTLRFGAATVLIEHPALPEEPGGELVVTQMVESMPYPPKLRIRNPPVPTRLNWLPEGPYRVEWSDAADGFVADPITISVSADGEPALVELKVREMTGEERERLGLRR